MQYGKQNNPAKYYGKKKTLFLVLIWGAIAISIGVILLLYFLKIDENYLYIVGFIELVIVFILFFTAKSRISYYDMHHRYHLLLSTNIGYEKAKCSFDDNWVEKLKKLGYISHINNNSFLIFYRIGKSIARKSLLKTTVIEIITIIKNNDINFYSDIIEEEYKKIWIRNEKKDRINKQVILQFKKYTDENDIIIKELNEIISFKDRDNYLITINCGYFEKSKRIYYLHSDTYYPNAYYKYGVDLIKELTE